MSQPSYEAEIREQRSRGYTDLGSNNGKLALKKSKIGKRMGDGKVKKDSLAGLAKRFETHAKTFESARKFKHSDKPF